MREQDLEQSSVSSDAKTHDEILRRLEEIKEFEKKYQKYDIIENEAEEELIEVGIETFEEIEPSVIEEEKKPRFKDKFKKLRAKPEAEKVEKEINPAIFKIRFNEEGKLENVDFKMRKPKIKSDKSGKRFSLKKLRLRRKGKTESTTAEGAQETSKASKLKGVLGKLKRIIPNKSKKTEEPTEPVATEE